MRSRNFRRRIVGRAEFPLRWLLALLVLAAPASGPVGAQQPQAGPQPVVHRVQAQNERLELLVNSSRIIRLDSKIPQVQVNNPEILSVTPLSPTELQVSAKKPGVTQINIWNEDDKVYTVDVMVIGDARELAMILRSQFPTAALKVMPLANSVIISGFVDDPAQVNQVIAVAEDYYPKVHNHITVGGGQQVLLQVRVMEVSRTKLRTLGVDWANVSANGSWVASDVSGLLKASQVPVTTVTAASGIIPNAAATAGKPLSQAISSGSETFSYGIMGPNNAFFSFINALRQDELAKILAEPNLTTISGRPARVNVGGEFPIAVPQSLGTVSIQYKSYGTQVDFVPIVLGNGYIRLEVKPRVSELDYSVAITVNGTSVPALKVREIDTGVEMKAGQTLALAGLVQQIVDTTKVSVPFFGELPYIGTMFRKVSEQVNEVELLIMVTPQFVEAMDPYQVPNCGPGTTTTTPSDGELYLKGYIEVPKVCPPGNPDGPIAPPPGTDGDLLPTPAPEVAPGGSPFAATGIGSGSANAVLPSPSPPPVTPAPPVLPEIPPQSTPAAVAMPAPPQPTVPPAPAAPPAKPAEEPAAQPTPASPAPVPPASATPAAQPTLPSVPPEEPKAGASDPAPATAPAGANPSAQRPGRSQGVRIVPLPGTRVSAPIGSPTTNNSVNPDDRQNPPVTVPAPAAQLPGIIGSTGYDVLN